MISVDNLAVEFSGSTLFSEVSFVINPTDKIALMGKNGAGKSTMMKIIAGVQKATRGHVRVPKDAMIAYLPQHLLTEDNCTVFEEAAKAFSHVFAMGDEIEQLNKALETRTDYESDEYMAIIEKVSDLGEKFYALEDVNYDAEVEKALKGLGFKQEDFTRQTKEFSGGWRMRVLLAKMILQQPDVLLLDEPTNHLDLPSIEWLEKYLLHYQGSVVIVSHDKFFLNRMVNKIVEVYQQSLHIYSGDYNYYETEKALRIEMQQKAFENQQDYIRQQERFIERFKAKASKAAAAQSIQKRLDKIDKIDDIQIATMQNEILNVIEDTYTQDMKLQVARNSLSPSFSQKKLTTEEESIAQH